MRDVTGDDEWGRVKERTRHEVFSRGGVRAVERASGVSATTITKLLEAQPVRRQDRLAVLAAYFGWSPDAFDRIRRGDEPLPLDGAEAAAPAEAPVYVLDTNVVIELHRRVEHLEESVDRQEATLRSILERLDSGAPR